MNEPLHVARADATEERLRNADAYLYGEEREDPDIWSAAKVDALFVEEIRARVRRDKDAFILVWGDPGSGKSTFVLDHARKIDPTFTPETLPSRVAFYADEVATLYDTTPRYGAAWIDEAGSAGLLSTEPASSFRQRSLVELINIIRAKNVVLFCVIPSPDNLAKSVRVRRADYRVECQPLVEGEPAVAYLGRKVVRRHFFVVDSNWLGFSDDEHGVPLTWPDYRTNPDPTLRAYWDAYRPLKEAFMENRTKGIERGLKALRRREEREDE